MSVFQKQMFQRVVRESRDRVKTYCDLHRTLGGSNFQDRYAPRCPGFILVSAYWLIPMLRFSQNWYPLFSWVLTSLLCWFDRYLCNFGSLQPVSKPSSPAAAEVREQSSPAGPPWTLTPDHFTSGLWLGLGVKAAIEIRIQNSLALVSQVFQARLVCWPTWMP